MKCLQLCLLSFPPHFRTRCQRWSVKCRPALPTLLSVCAQTPAVSRTVLTASMCPPSCSTLGCLRWSAWSVMDTLSACPSQASSAGQCYITLYGRTVSTCVLWLPLKLCLSDSFTSHPPVSSLSLFLKGPVLQLLGCPTSPPSLSHSSHLFAFITVPAGHCDLCQVRYIRVSGPKYTEALTGHSLSASTNECKGIHCT